MKKKLFMLSGALLVMALSVAIFARKPMTAEEALILKNVEALAQGEESLYCTEGLLYDSNGREHRVCWEHGGGSQCTCGSGTL